MTKIQEVNYFLRDARKIWDFYLSYSSRDDDVIIKGSLGTIWVEKLQDGGFYVYLNDGEMRVYGTRLN